MGNEVGMTADDKKQDQGPGTKKRDSRSGKVKVAVSGRGAIERNESWICSAIMPVPVPGQ